MSRPVHRVLLFQVCRMASDYSRTCVSPDSIQTGEAPVVSETCEVYVWGSNSSHQLVEGTQEKILQPKLAASFADAQTVRENGSRVCCGAVRRHMLREESRDTVTSFKIKFARLFFISLQGEAMNYTVVT